MPAGEADARGVLPAADLRLDPFCLSPPGTGPTSAAESPGLSFKPTEGDAENPLEHRGMHEKELEQRHPRPPGPYLTVDWYTRSSRLR